VRLFEELTQRSQRFAPRDPPADVLCVTIDVVPEFLQSTAQVVQAKLTVGSTNQPVLGTLTIAGK
jgi:hypothetical protein